MECQQCLGQCGTGLESISFCSRCLTKVRCFRIKIFLKIWIDHDHFSFRLTVTRTGLRTKHNHCKFQPISPPYKSTVQYPASTWNYLPLFASLQATMWRSSSVDPVQTLHGVSLIRWPTDAANRMDLTYPKLFLVLICHAGCQKIGINHCFRITTVAP